VPLVGWVLQVQIPGSRKIVLTALISFLFCSEHCFKQVVGREVSERPGTAEKQS